MPISGPSTLISEEERKAESESERRMRLAARAAKLGIYDWHIPSDTAIWENDEMYRIFGRDPSEGPLSNAEFINEYVHPDDVPLFRQIMEATIANGSAFHYTCRIRIKTTGEQQWVEYNGELELEPNGEPLRLRGVIQDITERRRLENDRERFLDLGSDLQVITGTDGMLKWVSPTFEKLLGWSPGEIEDTAWTTLVHPDDRDVSVKESLDLIAGGRTHSFQNRYRHKNGHYVWLQWNARSYPQEGTIHGVATDITEQKLAEQDRSFLMEITDRLAHLTDPQVMMREVGRKLIGYLAVSRCVFVEYDLEGGRATLVHEECARVIPSVAGTYSLGPMIDPGTMRALHKGEQLIIGDLRDHPLAVTHYDLFASMAIAASLTSPYVSDGKCKCGISLHQREPRNWSAREAKLMKDVSERTWSSIERARIGQRLKHSRDRLRLVTDAIPVLISYLDKDHFYRFVNKKYTDWFNVDREEIIGRHLKEIVGEVVYQATLPRIERVLSGETLKYEQLHPYKFGGTRYVEVTFVPDRSEDGQIHGWYALVQDITERKAHEDAMTDAERRKDEFLATLSHELRNPMAPLKSAIEILDMEVTESEAQHAKAIMKRQVSRMTHLIDDLMDISRISRGKIDLYMKPLDLKKAIVEAVEATDPLIREQRHSLALSLPDGSMIINADEDRMVQVLTNLLSNAAKYTDPGGEISIELSERGGHAVVQLRDTGIGLAPENVERIFEMFSQVSFDNGRGQGGLGIGLNLVKNLVAMHNGTITAESPGLGKGSIFTLSIPLADRTWIEDPIALGITDRKGLR